MDCTWIACSPPGTSTCPASAWGRSLPSTSAGSQISSSLGELSHNLRLSTEVYLQLFKIHPNPSELICKNLSESISGKRSATALSVILLRITWLSPHHSHRQTSEQTSVWGGGEDQNSHFFLVFTLKYLSKQADSSSAASWQYRRAIEPTSTWGDLLPQAKQVLCYIPHL